MKYLIIAALLFTGCAQTKFEPWEVDRSVAMTTMNRWDIDRIIVEVGRLNTKVKELEKPHYWTRSYMSNDWCNTCHRGFGCTLLYCRDSIITDTVWVKP